MTAKIGRPVEFVTSKREMFCALVGVGVSRRHAAASVGVAPSTVTRAMAADDAFADGVRDAENGCELDLMKRVRLQSERSWRAAVWLLERMRPERYARGKAAPAAPSWDEMFDRFIALIDEEVGDEALRERLARRLDEMAVDELAAQQLDDPAQVAMGELPLAMAALAEPPQSPASARDLAAQAGAHNGLHGDKAAPSKSSQSKAGKVVPPSRAPTLERSARSNLDAAGRVEDLLGRVADFCNTSPMQDAHERRALQAVSR